MHFNRYLLSFILFICGAASVKAQETTVRFKIINSKNEAVSFATVNVISVPDTIHLQQKVSDSTGIAIFQLLQGKPYIIRVTSVNYKPLEKNITIKGDNPLYSLVAEPVSASLSNVVVTATKPMMRQEDDKTIVDPETLAAASTNAYEILEKTTGIFIDQDGNLYLNSTTPSRIYINGREQKMSAADIATMLKNLPPNAIASIEIMRTPSAKYDASGGGGIVNIVLRKGVKIGFTGTVTTGFNQGRYGNQFIGLNLNNNNGSLTTYLNLQYGRRNTYDQLQTDRLYSVDSLLSQEAFTRYGGTSYYLGYGISYGINKKWEINYDGRLSYNDQNNRSTNLSQTSKTGSSQISSA